MNWSSPSLNSDTSSPPTSVRRLLASVSMLTPRSAARARSTLIRNSGWVGSKLEATSTTPGISRTLSINCTVYAWSCSMSGPWMRMLRPFDDPPPPPRPPPPVPPEMSVLPDTLMRAPWYLRSSCRTRIIISCCDTVRSSRSTIVTPKLPCAGFTPILTRRSAGSASISFSIGWMNSSVRW